MKAILIAFDQVQYDNVLRALKETGIRGFTAWKEVIGRGSHSGDPHFGSHAWPVKNNAIFVTVEDDQCPRLLERLRELDKAYPLLGIHAYSWQIEEMI